MQDDKRVLLVTVALGWLLVLGTRFVVPAVLPRIKAEFAVSNATVGIAVTVMWVTYAAMQFPAGVLADRIGERHLLAGSLVLTAVSLLGFGVVPAFALFLVTTATFGLGTGLYGPSRGTVIAKTFEERDGLAFGVVLATGAALLMLFVFQGLTAFFTTYLVEVKGLSQGTAGGLFALLFLSGAAFQSVAGTAADRYGHERVLVAIAVVSAPPLAAFPFLDGLAPLGVVAVLLGIRPAMGPVSNAYIVGVLPNEVQGAAWGLLRTGFFTVGSFGSVFVGVLADRALFGEAFLLLAGLTVVAAALYVFLPPRADAAGPAVAD